MVKKEEKIVPTESNEFSPGKLLYKDQEGIIKELCSYEFKEENSDDAVDAMEYAAKGMTDKEISVTVEVPREKVRKILKMYGLEKITRKRFKKLLMGYGIQRNDAEVIAEQFYYEKLPYTPLAVYEVIKTIIKENEREVEQC